MQCLQIKDLFLRPLDSTAAAAGGGDGGGGGGGGGGMPPKLCLQSTIMMEVE